MLLILGLLLLMAANTKKLSNWTEVNNLTNESQTITVNYDATTGEVSSLSIA